MDNFYFLLSFIFYSMATPGTSDWNDKNGIGKGVIGITKDITSGSRDKKTSFEFYQNTIWLLLIPFEILTIIYFTIYASEQFSFTLIVFSSLLFGLFGYGIRRLLGLPIVVFQILGTAFLILSLANLISFSRFQTNVSQTAPTESGGASVLSVDEISNKDFANQFIGLAGQPLGSKPGEIESLDLFMQACAGPKIEKLADMIPSPSKLLILERLKQAQLVSEPIDKEKVKIYDSLYREIDGCIDDYMKDFE